VLPDNCIDILWQDNGAPAFAVGMMTRAIHVVSDRAVRTVAVRFKPGAAGIFLAQGQQQAPPLHELADRRTDLGLLWGRSGADRLADALWAHGLDDAARLALLERHLLERLPGLPGITPLVAAALHAIDGSGGALRIEALADSLGVSRQHLAAQFRARVGLAPKMYARICRFRRATGALAAEPARSTAPDWAGLALDCGYFDQSHLIHDFQEFSGGAPESFLR
jgi:AraC-like DNA-binding protein